MVRKITRLTLFLLVLMALAAPAALLAQEQEGSRGNPLMAVLFTWAPVLLIVFLWWFFMRKAGFGKGGYKQYMAQSLGNAESINRNLERIATQMERLVALKEKSEGGPRST